MKQRINVKQAIIENDELHLMTDGELDLSVLEPSGQMLVDSDQLAFVYLAAVNNEYAYISIPENTWSIVNRALSSNLPAYLRNEQSHLELSGYREELNYLIENIKGNSNYGEEMVGKVESIF